MSASVWEFIAVWSAEGTFLKHFTLSGVCLIFIGFTYTGDVAAKMTVERDGFVPVTSVSTTPFGVFYRRHRVHKDTFETVMKLMRIPLLGLLFVGVVGMIASGLRTVLG